MNAHQTERLRELSTYLEQTQEGVTQRWLAAVRADPVIRQAGSLTSEQLVDHVPRIYSEVCRELKSARGRTGAGDIERDARRHGHYRWTRGYRLDELVRELDLLRKCIREATTERVDDPDPATAIFHESNCSPQFGTPDAAAGAALQRGVGFASSLPERRSLHKRVDGDLDEVDAFFDRTQVHKEFGQQHPAKQGELVGACAQQFRHRTLELFR